MGRFAGYIRVSSIGSRDRDRFLSPTLQHDRIASWCTANGHELVEVREDLDVSGGSAERENLLDLVQRVERGELDGVIVAKLDRFARSIVHGVSLIERIVKADGWFVSVADGFDTRTPYGRLALNIMLSFAQFELERYRDGWRESRAKMIEQGRHSGPSAPVGYDRRDDGVLIPGKHADLIRELFTRRAGGESQSVLARWLADHGVTTGRGNRPTARFVRELVGRRAYLGEAFAGEFTNPAAHEPLVDEITWLRANQAAGPQPQRSQVNAPALSGLVRCEGCRYVMGAANSPYAGGAKRAYRCRGQHSAGDCPRPAFVLEEQLLPMVEERFFVEIGNLTADAAGDQQRIDALTAARDEARHALVVYRDTASTILTAADYADGLRVRQAAVDEADRALGAELASRPSGLPDAATLRLMWGEMPAGVRRRMFAAVFDAIVVKKPVVHRSHSEPLSGRVRFVARGGLPGDVPRPGRRPVGVRSFWPDDPAGAGVSVG